jgi:inorganic pyrophosphatase
VRSRRAGRAAALPLWTHPGSGVNYLSRRGEIVEFDVVIEIPKGQRNKYEMDHETGRIRLDRTLFTSTRYPADYGFVEHTLAHDGDPLDALVLLEEPTFPGYLISSRAIGMFRMRDEMGLDGKVQCVAATDPRMAHLRDIEEVSEFDRPEWATSLRFTRRWSPARKWTRLPGWTGRPPIARSRCAGSGRASLAIRAASGKPTRQVRGWRANSARAYALRSRWPRVQANTLVPVMARPAISVLISLVPLYQ